jgi:hypothetical protein
MKSKETYNVGLAEREYMGCFKARIILIKN